MDQYVPPYNLQKHFAENYWDGLWWVLIVSLLGFVTILYSVQTLFDLPVITLLLSPKKFAHDPKYNHKRTAALSLVIGLVLVCLVGVTVYVYSQGGLTNTGTDRMQQPR